MVKKINFPSGLRKGVRFCTQRDRLQAKGGDFLIDCFEMKIPDH